MPDGHYVKCADCGQEYDALHCFRIVPPHGRSEGGGHVYFICVPCWEKIIGGAMMSMLR